MIVRFWGGPICGEIISALPALMSRDVYETYTDKAGISRQKLIGTYVREDLVAPYDLPPESRCTEETRFIYRDGGADDWRGHSNTD